MSCGSRACRRQPGCADRPGQFLCTIMVINLFAAAGATAKQLTPGAPEVRAVAVQAGIWEYWLGELVLPAPFGGKGGVVCVLRIKGRHQSPVGVDEPDPGF